MGEPARRAPQRGGLGSLPGLLRGILGRGGSPSDGAPPGGAASGRGGAPIPNVWTLLEWLELIGLSDRPFGLEDFRLGVARAMGLKITFLDARTALRGRARDPGAAYQLLRSELVGAGTSGGMVRDPMTEDAVILTPGETRREEAPKPFYHELMHVALGDPVPVSSAAPFPEGAEHKLRLLPGPCGDEVPYWIPESRLFPADLVADYALCERRAETLAGHAVLAGEFGGEDLRSMDDYFWA